MVLALMTGALLPAQASASTITGRVSGTLIPAEGAGAAVVRAVDLATGRVAAARELVASGRFRLVVPKGHFAVLQTVVEPKRLRRPKPASVRLRAGQRRAVRAAAAVARSPIVSIPDDAFRGLTGDLAVFNKAMTDMLITDLAIARTPSNCQITLRDVSARFMGAYRVEITLPSRGGDPATAPRPGRLLTPTRGIRGRFTVTGTGVRVNAEVYRWSNGRTLGRTSATGSADSIIALEEDLARKLAALLCDRPPPITGTFSGSVNLNRSTGLPSDARFDWTGSVVLEPEIASPFSPVVFYSVRSGSVTVSLRGSGQASGCAFAGNGSFDLALPRAGPVAAFAMSTTDGDPETYELFFGAPAAAITATLSGCQDPAENGTTFSTPLGGIRLVPSGARPVAGEGDYSGTLSAPGTAGEGAYDWRWILLG